MGCLNLFKSLIANKWLVLRIASGILTFLLLIVSFNQNSWWWVMYYMLLVIELSDIVIIRPVYKNDK